MPRYAHITLLGLSALLLLSGLILRVMMRRHLTPAGEAVKWYDVRAWFSPWSAVDYLTPLGLRYHLTSLACIMVGLGLYFLEKQF